MIDMYNMVYNNLMAGNFSISGEHLKDIMGKFVKVIIIIIIMYILIKVGSSIINKFVENQKKFRFSLNEKKAKTLGEILKSILKYFVYFFGIVTIFTQIFGNVGLTFAGIGGVAIGFGAQNVIKDIINGLFILMEDQYVVGDYINIDDKGGIVESIELRVTKLKDLNGDLHIIPNGLITKVTNHSRGPVRVLVEIDIDYEEDLDRAIDLITSVCEEASTENENLVETPKVTGVVSSKESSLTIKVTGKAKPMTQGECELELRRRIKKKLDKNNVKYPHPRRIIKD